jgi:hypothetical protein
MNLPSSLALPQSKLLRGRTGILVLALLVSLLGGALYFAMRAGAPPKTPTPATSPAAQAPVKTAPVPKVPAPVVYGPPAPDWVERVPVPAASVASTALAGSVVPGPATALVSPAAGASAAAVPSAAVTTVPGEQGVEVGSNAAETPKSLDASVLFARDQYTYTSGGRRDPFQSLLDGKFQGSGDGSLVDVGDIHLVGIMWGASDKFALVEDSRGRGFVLRVGDPVVNGYISGIAKSELQIVQNAFGESQTLSIKLQPKEGDENAARN